MLRRAPFNNPLKGGYASVDQVVRLTYEKTSPGSTVLNSRTDADDCESLVRTTLLENEHERSNKPTGT